MPASSDENNSTLFNSAEISNDKVMKQDQDDQAKPISIESRKDNSKDEKVLIVSPSKGEDVEGEDDLSTELEKEHADNLRRKRDREGSLEPSFSSQQGTTTNDTIPSKKNRLQHAIIGKEQTTSTLAPSSPSLKSEGEKVGQIRKRVQDLSWKQRKEGDRDGEEEEIEEEAEEEGDDDEPEEIEGQEQEITAEATETTAEPKKTQPSFSSFASKPSAFAAAKKDESNFLSSPASSTEKKTGSPTNSSRTQPTFSSFSKSSSPFNSMSSVAGPSWLAGKAGSGAGVTASASTGGGGIRPSSLGSVGAQSSSDCTDTIIAPAFGEKDRLASNAKTTNTSSTSGKQLGFGAFAGNKTFTSRSSTPTASSERAVNGDEDGESSPGRSFDDVLKQGEVKEAERVETNKVSTQLERGQADLRTGEEDERTLASARSKLYTMSEDKNWKERGTGTVRCNVAKQNGGSGRLVMRSEGVLRLILNINLFKGMKIELEQDKFLRIVAFEEEKLVHFAIKFANNAAATNFYRVVKETIPSEDQEWETKA